jgi:ABC-2 type transport system permease protein
MNANPRTDDAGGATQDASGGQGVMEHAVRPLLTLVKREFWEHRSLWLWPLCAAGLMIVTALFGHVNLDGSPVSLTPQTLRTIFAVAVWAFGMILYVTMVIVLWFYATDCLYSERRDRSILFWKSMPVSDAETVLSKVLIAMVVVPLGVYVLAAATSLVVSAIFSLRAATGSIPFAFWDTGTWLRVQGFTLATTIIFTLWYAPLTGYLMLVSAWARRNVQLWVLLPPLVLMLIEHFTFGTHYVSRLLYYRLHGLWPPGFEHELDVLFNDSGAMPVRPGAHAPFGGDPFLGFANIDLWLGVAFGALCVLAAIRIRRYRDDS